VKKFLVLLIIPALLLGLMISGCEPEEVDPVDPVDPDEPVEVAQEIAVAIGVEPENLDPLKMTSAPAATVSEHMVENLLYLNEDGELEPALAVNWEVADDGMSYLIELREGVTFHDGEPFNAEAVKYNLDRFMGKGEFEGESPAVFGFLLGEVDNVEVVDEYTIRINMDELFAPLAFHLSHSFIAMHSPASIDALAEGDDITAPVGTGPFKYSRWDRGEQIVMERNEDYWGGAPEIEEATFKFVPEGGSRVIMIETGEVDAVMDIPFAEIDRLEAAEGINIVYEDSVRNIYIGFNMESDLFKNNKELRQAINYAVDKQAICDAIFAGAYEPATAPIVPAVFGYHQAGPYEYDPERAMELLAEAGYEDGFEMELYHPTGRYPMDATVAETVQGMLAEVGIQANLSTFDWGTFLEVINQENPDDAEHDAYMLGWGTVTWDADYGLYPLFHSDEWPPASNRAYYANEEVDALLEQARREMDPGVREQLYAEAIQLIWDDAPWLFLYNQVQVNAELDRVEGLIHHPLENISVWDARIVE